MDSFGLCSFDDPVKVLIELQRVCKPEGKILLLEHGRSKTYLGLSGYLDKHAERHAKNWVRPLLLVCDVTHKYISVRFSSLVISTIRAVVGIEI